MKYIIAIGIFQAVFTAILLLRNRYKSNGDDLLISLVVCISLHLSIKFFIFTYVPDLEVVSMMNTFIWFSYIPLLYLYTVKTIQNDFIPATRWYVFIPFFVFAIGYFSVVSLLITTSPESHSALHLYNSISLWVIIPTEIIAPCLILQKAQKKLPKHSDEKRLIIQISSLFIAIGILSFLFILLEKNSFLNSTFTRSIIYMLLIVISLRIIVYKFAAIVNQPKQKSYKEVLFSNTNYDAITAINGITNEVSTDFFTEEEAIGEIKDKERVVNPIQEPSKRKEILSQSEMFKMLLKLENSMKSEHHYKDSELTLDKLSKLTKLNKAHITETLNHFVNKPFYTFVNEYRIQFAKGQLTEMSAKNIKINVLEIAFQAGFNSKSSFNRYFKEITTLTPSEYITKINSKTKETTN